MVSCTQSLSSRGNRELVQVWKELSYSCDMCEYHLYSWWKSRAGLARMELDKQNNLKLPHHWWTWMRSWSQNIKVLLIEYTWNTREDGKKLQEQANDNQSICSDIFVHNHCNQSAIHPGALFNELLWFSRYVWRLLIKLKCFSLQGLVKEQGGCSPFKCTKLAAVS